MLWAGVLLQLALACAWVYDSMLTTWSTELTLWNVFMLFSLYLLVHALCWCTISTSTSIAWVYDFTWTSQSTKWGHVERSQFT